MDCGYKQVLFLLLGILLQGHFSPCTAEANQKGGDGAAVPIDALKDEKSGVASPETSNIPTDRVEIEKAIKTKTEEKERLLRERQDFVKTVKEEKRSKTEEVKEKFKEEGEKQNKEKKTLREARDKLHEENKKFDREIRTLERQIRRNRRNPEIKAKFENQLKEVKKQRDDMNEEHKAKKKSILEERKARVAVLQEKADQLMIERKQIKVDAKKKLAAMDVTINALDTEINLLKAALEKAQA